MSFVAVTKTPIEQTIMWHQDTSFLVRRNRTVWVLLLCLGCSSEKSVETAPTVNPTEPTAAVTQTSSLDQVQLKQLESDLLAGVTRAVCYSGFRQGQHPDRGDGAVNPTEDQIKEDLLLLSQDSKFKLIRLYDSGENSRSVLDVISKNGLDIKVMLGIWLSAELSAHETCAWLTEPIPEETLQANKLGNEQEVQRGIELASEFPDVVVAVNVGNETLVDWNDHKVSLDSVLSYVAKVKAAIEQPVTVAENYKWWAERGQELAQAVDFIAVHTYPVWEGKSIDEGLSYSIENLTEVRQSLPDVPMVIGEAGWASESSEFGERASETHQQQYYEELMSWADENNVTTFFFEAFDEDWKGDPNNPLGAEKHWGIYTIDRKPKQVMKPSTPTATVLSDESSVKGEQ